MKRHALKFTRLGGFGYGMKLLVGVGEVVAADQRVEWWMLVQCLVGVAILAGAYWFSSSHDAKLLNTPSR